jgi:hypothetical protein
MRFDILGEISESKQLPLAPEFEKSLVYGELMDGVAGASGRASLRCV